jgi:hypothetical protein
LSAAIALAHPPRSHPLQQQNHTYGPAQRYGAIPQEVGDRAGVGTTLNTIGAVYRNLGQYEQALVYFTEALAVRRHSWRSQPTVTTIGAIAQLSLQRSHQLPL